ncbi:FCD domain-containing protein [Silicimonas sp. MF1-12-2]|uniref:FCD domain-containing protein n=1 Tax=Silicimonas sp. MF1-12-2 TaxID=3384793 RepID=UPI0039B5A850
MLNIEFHDLLMNGAGNPKAMVIYENLVKGMHLFRQKGLSISTNIARSIDEHEAICDAVAAADPEAAWKAANAHIVAGFGRYMKIVDQKEQAAL